MYFRRNYTLLFIANLFVDLSGGNSSFLSDIHNKLFVNSSCVYLVTDNNKWSWSFLTFNIQLVSVNFNQFKKFLLRKLSFVCDGYIMICNDYEAINTMFSSNSINLFFAPHHTVLLLINNSTCLNFTEIRKATELQNLELVIVNKETNSTKAVSMRHGIVDGMNYFSKRYKHRWIPHKILRKYNRTFSVVYFNCPPFVSPNFSSGVELKMIKETLKNWPIEFFLLPQINGLIGNSHSESIKLIAQNKYDAAVCAHWINKLLLELNVTKTYPYILNCINFLVPRPQLLPDYSFIFQSFQATIWSLYFAIVLASICIPHIVLKLIGSIQPIDSSYSIGIIRLLSLGGVTRFPYLKFSTVKVLVVTLSIFCLLLSIYFCAGVATSLRFPRFSNKLNNIDDMLENNLKWTDSSGTNYFQFWMNQTHIPKFEKLAKNFENFHSVSVGNEMIRQKNHGLIVQSCAGKSINYVMYSEILDKDNRNILKMIHKDIACFYITLPLRYNSPYLKIFNQVYPKYTEYGFIKYWLQKYVNTKQHRYMNLFFRTYSDEVRQYITLEKLQGVFYLLLAGHGLAAVVFFFEKWLLV